MIDLTDPETIRQLAALAPGLRAYDDKLAADHAKRNKIQSYFPAEGPRRRELYQKHIEFFAAGAKYKERLFMAANRTGKTDSGAFEVTCHLTGIYPDWWTGRRFYEPVEVWACGTTSETTRDIVQAKLLGPIGAEGTGMIPADLILKTTPRKSGISGSLESALVKHVSGVSTLGLKTYEQGRKSFEGTHKQVIWDDEEPPEDIYTEQLLRTVTAKGIVLITFTPLQGMSAVVKGFIEPEDAESREFKFYVQAGWKDVPHLDEAEKRAVSKTMPAYQIKARTEGEPSLGAGAIYPIAESAVTVKWFEIPKSWPRAYALDVGWKRTAALWLAQDPGSGTLYFYDEHYVGQGEPPSHAWAIKQRGEWIMGAVDPACLGSSQIDGRQLMAMYRELGLTLVEADNAVESGIAEVWGLLVSGRLKIFDTCQNFFREFRKYHRDDKGNGKIVKTEDHMMDCARYAIVTGRKLLTVDPRLTEPVANVPQRRGSLGFAR